MVGKKRSNGFNISNKLAYTFIAIFSFVLIGVGVYAYGGSAPSTMGHSMGEIAFPACSTGQYLKWDGGAWVCGVPNKWWAPSSIVLSSTTTNGNAGGYLAMESKCSAGYHVCTSSELIAAMQQNVDFSAIPTYTYYWYFGPANVPSIVQDCTNWANSGGTQSGSAFELGMPSDTVYRFMFKTQMCSTSLKVICCSDI
jgi:hypothetical protein